jgi:uncharacterized protein YlzI (FlbEa/FlbD family)
MLIPTRLRVAPVIVAVLILGAASAQAGQPLAGPALRVLAQSGPFAPSGGTARPLTWIKLTGPTGQLIYINVEQITSVRSDTAIPGARAQLDLASGKFQGVRESVEQVMELIAATSGTQENEEAPSAALVR